MTTLRVGVVVDDLTVPSWVAAIVDGIVRSTVARLELAVVERSEVTRAPIEMSSLVRGYLAWDDRWFQDDCQPDALAPASLASALSEVRQVATSRDLGEMDLVLDLSDVDRRLTATARLGVWRVWSDCPPADGGFAPWASVLLHQPTTQLGISRRGATDSSPQLLATSAVRTDPLSSRRNTSRACWQAAALLLHTLGRVARMGSELALEATAASSSAPSIGNTRPGGLDVLRLAGRTVRRRLHAALVTEQWGMGFSLHRDGTGPDVTLANFTFALPPKSYTWADPFVVKRGDNWFVFFEELPFATDKGHISVLSISPDGQWRYLGVALAQPHHMSYPFLFEWNGELFMVPEEGSGRRLVLYRCTSFPDRWEPERELMTGVRAVDTTLLHHDDLWWMFTSMPGEGASADAECRLLTAPSLNAPWTPHPSSPIATHPANARPAGALFRRADDLFRPAQDCSVRYGGRMVVNRVTTLTRRHYAEHAASVIAPSGPRGIVATHTLNTCGSATVVDALFERSRLSVS